MIHSIRRGKTLAGTIINDAFLELEWRSKWDVFVVCFVSCGVIWFQLLALARVDMNVHPEMNGSKTWICKGFPFDFRV